MKKDYNYWRQRYITSFYDKMNKTFIDMDEYEFTPIEAIAFMHLSNLQNFYGLYYLSIIPQYVIGDYRVDFLVIFELPESEKKKFVIECDGHEFHEKTKEQASKDKKRDRELQKDGYTIFRYSGSDIVNEPGNIARDLVAVIGVPEWVIDYERSVSNK